MFKNVTGYGLFFTGLENFTYFFKYLNETKEKPYL
jgi:hypothetical protein